MQPERKPRPALTYPKLVDAILPGVVQFAGGDPRDLDGSLSALQGRPEFEEPLHRAVENLRLAIQHQSNGNLREDLIIGAALSLLGRAETLTRAHVSVLKSILPTCAIEGARSKPLPQKVHLEGVLEEAFKSALYADKWAESGGDAKALLWDRGRPQWRTIVTLGNMLLELADNPQQALEFGARLYKLIVERYGAGLKASTFDWMQFRVQSDAMRHAILTSKPVTDVAEAHVQALIGSAHIPFGEIVEACNLFGNVRATACRGLLDRARDVVKKVSKLHQPTGTTGNQKRRPHSFETLAHQCQELANAVPFQVWGARGLSLSENNRAGISNLFGKAIRAAIAEPQSPLVQVVVRTLAVAAEPSLGLISVDTVVPRKELKIFLRIAAKSTILDSDTAPSLFALTRYSKSTDVHKFCENVLGAELTSVISRVIAEEDYNAELLGEVDASITWAILYSAVDPHELQIPLERRNRYINSLEQLDATALLTAAITLACDSVRKLRAVEHRLAAVFKSERYDAGFLTRTSDNPLTALKTNMRPIPELLPRGGSEELIRLKEGFVVCGDPSHSLANLNVTVQVLRGGALRALFPSLQQCDLYAIAQSLAIGSPAFKAEPVRFKAKAFELDRLADRVKLHLAHKANVSADLLLEKALNEMDVERCGPDEERAYLRLMALRVGNEIHAPAVVAKLARAHFEAVESSSAGLRVKNYIYARGVLGKVLERVEAALGDPEVSRDLVEDVDYLAYAHLRLLLPAPDTQMPTVSFFHAQRMSTRFAHLFFQLHGIENLETGRRILGAIHHEIEQFETLLEFGYVSWSVVNAFVDCINRFERIAHFAHTTQHREVVSRIRVPFERVAKKFETYAREHEPSEDRQGRLLGAVIECRTKLSSEVLNP